MIISLLAMAAVTHSVQEPAVAPPEPVSENSEFGDTNPPASVSEPNAWVRQVLDALELRQCHWTAWDFHPLAGPCLVDKDYQPTPSFGKLVKSALAH